MSRPWISLIPNCAIEISLVSHSLRSSVIKAQEVFAILLSFKEKPIILYSSIGFPSRPQCEHKNKNQQQYQCRTLTMQDVRRAHQMFYEIPDKIKQDEKGLCKRGKTITSMKPNVINKGVQTVMDDEENNEQDHESDFIDINEEEEFS
ncbi:hypothetical protein QTP88_017378 [Uroleucon formosanum]